MGTSVQRLALPNRVGAIITSPPYMNALDYGRDNRLRLWFIDPSLVDKVDNDVTRRRQAFIDAMTGLATKLELVLKPGGYCVFVVGEEVRGSVGNSSLRCGGRDNGPTRTFVEAEVNPD